MYPSAKAAKTNAKSLLKGQWLNAIAVSAVLIAAVGLLIFVEYLIATVFNVYDLAFFSSIDYINDVSVVAIIIDTAISLAILCVFVWPVFLGVYRWFWHLSADEPLAVGQIFCYFAGDMLKKSIKFFLSFFLKVLKFGILVFMPYILAVVISSPQLYGVFGATVPVFMASFAPLIDLLYIIGHFFLFLYIFKMYLFVPIYCNDDDISVHEVFETAKRLSGHTVSGYVGFLFSFILWILLSLLGIPMIFTVPYFLCANACYCRYALNYGKKVTDFIENKKI